MRGSGVPGVDPAFSDLNTKATYLKASGCFRKFGVLLAGVLMNGARLFGVYVRAPECWSSIWFALGHERPQRHALPA